MCINAGNGQSHTHTHTHTHVYMNLYVCTHRCACMRDRSVLEWGAIAFSGLWVKQNHKREKALNRLSQDLSSTPGSDTV